MRLNSNCIRRLEAIKLIMNFLSQFYSIIDEQNISIAAPQGSGFAKNIADDFNPIHDVESKRFCVPGDLLFSIALQQYGLHQSMTFSFRELIKADTPLSYPSSRPAPASVDVLCDRSKQVLSIDYSGEVLTDADKIEQLIRSYVVFSGQNFPHILVPLMKKHNVMINPSRPLVIYESMSLSFDNLDFQSLNIELGKTELEVLGKRGNCTLHFNIYDQGRKIGTGLKRLVLSGLREYQQDSIDAMCEQYFASKDKQQAG